jgi:Protein of unknown function (DUF742)
VPARDGRHPPLDDVGLPADDEDFLVRPYAVTGGRTEPRSQLEIEAMVAAAYFDVRDLTLLSPECDPGMLPGLAVGGRGLGYLADAAGRGADLDR